MVIWVASLFAAICAWLWTPAAHACKCAPPDDATSAAASAAAVFEGQVTGINTADPQTLVVELKVAQAWKGVSSEQVSVRTPSESAACGYPFQVSESYLVYASTGEGGLRVLHCSRTRPLAEAKEDIAALGMASVPTAAHVPQEVEAQDNLKPGQANAVTAQQERPAAGGCASCSVGGAAGFDGELLWLGLGVLGVWGLRRRATRG